MCCENAERRLFSPNADRTFYERLCTSLDNQIDDLVYQLYDITPDERKIIEKS